MDSGVVELNLIAEDTNQYGMDRKDGKGLAQVGGARRVRVEWGRGMCGVELDVIAEDTNQHGIDRKDGNGLAQVGGGQEGQGAEGCVV